MTCRRCGQVHHRQEAVSTHLGPSRRAHRPRLRRRGVVAGGAKPTVDFPRPPVAPPAPRVPAAPRHRALGLAVAGAAGVALTVGGVLLLVDGRVVIGVVLLLAVVWIAGGMVAELRAPRCPACGEKFCRRCVAVGRATEQ